ncbi:MAG: LLM class flavin-dependent oxidoreductase [Chloroflexi bacterium]|nr:LLM class flavin-dependent oxidoreductase [Chloroflexota bacterium]
MSVRIGIGFGGWPFPDADPQHLWRYVDACEELDVDSLWLSDRIVSSTLNMEPIVALSFIAGRTEKLKVGTSVLAVPLRNPTILAKEIATLDFLSGGRSLPAIGLGTEDETEYEACGTKRSVRVSRTEEAVEVMRLLWKEDNVTYHGKHFTLNNVTIQPKPVFPPDGLPPIWIGGRSEAAMRRTARIGDGWLVSQATPEEVGEGVKKIKTWADEYGNDIEDDHYGALFAFCFADSREEAERIAAPYMLRRREDVDYNSFSAFGRPEDFIELVDRFVEAGADKFVVRPACPPEMMQEQLEILGREIVPRYHPVSDV